MVGFPGDKPERAHRISSRAKKAALSQDLLLLAHRASRAAAILALRAGQPVVALTTVQLLLQPPTQNDSAIPSCAISRTGRSPVRASASLPP